MAGTHDGSTRSSVEASISTGSESDASLSLSVASAAWSSIGSRNASVARGSTSGRLKMRGSARPIMHRGGASGLEM